MFVEVYDAFVPKRTLFFRGKHHQLVAIIDGSGDWGGGSQVADIARKKLATIWDRDEWDRSSLIRDVADVAPDTPSFLRDEEMPWRFSMGALRIRGGHPISFIGVLMPVS